MSELSLKQKADLFNLLDQKRWNELRTIFSLFTPKTRQKAEEWYLLVVDHDKMVEDKLIEAKEWDFYYLFSYFIECLCIS